MVGSGRVVSYSLPVAGFIPLCDVGRQLVLNCDLIICQRSVGGAESVGSTAAFAVGSGSWVLEA